VRQITGVLQAGDDSLTATTERASQLRSNFHYTQCFAATFPMQSAARLLRLPLSRYHGDVRRGSR
jgi:hypothetical protein